MIAMKVGALGCQQGLTLPDLSSASPLGFQAPAHVGAASPAEQTALLQGF